MIFTFLVTLLAFGQEIIGRWDGVLYQVLDTGLVFLSGK